MPDKVAARMLTVSLSTAVTVLTLASCSNPLRRCNEGCATPAFCDVGTQLCVQPDEASRSDGGGGGLGGGGGTGGGGASATGLVIAPDAFDFTATEIGQTSPTKEFVVQNRGLTASGTLTVSITGPDPGAFTKIATDCGPALEANATCSVSIAFSPGAPTNAATLQVTSALDPGAPVRAALTGTGQQPCHLDLRAKPGSSADFGSVFVNASQLETFILGNSGQVGCESLALGFSGTDAAMFDTIKGSAADCGASLAGGGECEVRVQHVPTSPGTHMATLEITTASGATTSQALTSTAVTSAGLMIKPDTVADFGNVLAGSTAVLNFTVTNGGGQASGTVTAEIAGNAAYSILRGAATDCATTLPGNASCTVRVQFAPTAGSSSSATVTVTASPGGTVTQQVKGNAQYEVSVTRSGSGSGLVSSIPTSSINCGTVCSAGFNYGDGVGLIATPDSNSAFSGWSGDCSGSGTCSLLITSPISAVATFTCVQKTCTSQGATCGSFPDGCGGTTFCGPCPPGLTCTNYQCV